MELEETAGMAVVETRVKDFRELDSRRYRWASSFNGGPERTSVSPRLKHFQFWQTLTTSSNTRSTPLYRPSSELSRRVKFSEPRRQNDTKQTQTTGESPDLKGAENTKKADSSKEVPKIEIHDTEGNLKEESVEDTTNRDKGTTNHDEDTNYQDNSTNNKDKENISGEDGSKDETGNRDGVQNETGDDQAKTAPVSDKNDEPEIVIPRPKVFTFWQKLNGGTAGRESSTQSKAIGRSSRTSLKEKWPDIKVTSSTNFRDTYNRFRNLSPGSNTSQRRADSSTRDRKVVETRPVHSRNTKISREDPTGISDLEEAFRLSQERDDLEYRQTSYRRRGAGGGLDERHPGSLCGYLERLVTPMSPHYNRIPHTMKHATMLCFDPKTEAENKMESEQLQAGLQSLEDDLLSIDPYDTSASSVLGVGKIKGFFEKVRNDGHLGLVLPHTCVGWYQSLISTPMLSGICQLSSIAVTNDGRVVILDRSHNRLMLFDSDYVIMADHLLPGHGGYCVALCTKDNEIAVCLERQLIKLFDISNNTFKERSAMTVECVDELIDVCFENETMCACSETAIVVNNKGKKWTIGRLRSGKDIFKGISSMKLNELGSSMFISDKKAAKVLCMDIYGKKQWDYFKQNFIPAALAYQQRHLYIAEYCKDRVVELTSTGKYVRYIVTEIIENPLALCVDKKNSMLVSEPCDRCVLVFGI